jgi:hypothetical protein
MVKEILTRWPVVRISSRDKRPHLHLPILDSAASSWSRSAISFPIRAFVCADRVFGNDTPPRR